MPSSPSLARDTRLPNAFARVRAGVARPWPACEWAWLAAAALLPIACNPWGSSAFELPKAALLRLLVLALVVLALRDYLVAPRQARPTSPWGSRLRWAAAAYLAALVLATVFSTEPLLSFVGSHGRQQGLLTQAFYVLLFLLTAHDLRTREQVERLWRVLVWASVPVVAYGFLQAAGIDPLGWQSDGASPVLSTLGRSNFLGGYLVQTMALTAGLLAGTRGRRTYVLLLLAQAACLAATRARGAWCGAAVVAAVFTLGVIPRHYRRVALSVAAATAIAASTLLASYAGAWTTSGSVAARLTIWRASWRLLAERPLLGYGPEATLAAFYRVFPPELVYYQGRGVMVDRAHNLWLDTGLSAGVVGVLALGAVLLAAAGMAWRGYSRAGDRQARLRWLALGAAIAGHVAELQFSFDLTGGATLFWLTLALLAAFPGESAAAPRPEPAARPAAPVRVGTLLLAPALAALLLALFTVALPLAADTYAGSATGASTPLPTALDRMSRAVRLWPIEPEYRLQLGLLLAQASDLAGASQQMAAAVALRPADPRMWLAQGGLYASHPEDAWSLSLAEASYRQALRLAPNLATMHAASGLLLATEGRLSEATAAFERAIALDATDYNVYEQLAAVYEAGGLTTEAERARSNAAYWRARTAAQAVPSVH